MIFIRGVKSKRMAESEAKLLDAVRSIHIGQRKAELKRKSFENIRKVIEK